MERTIMKCTLNILIAFLLAGCAYITGNSNTISVNRTIDVEGKVSTDLEKPKEKTK